LCPERRTGQKRACLGGRVKQFLDALAKSRLTGASLVQVLGAPGRRQSSSDVKDGCFAIGRGSHGLDSIVLPLNARNRREKRN
jgi:hypothetical protein